MLTAVSELMDKAASKWRMTVSDELARTRKDSMKINKVRTVQNTVHKDV
jgi:hypothetical protein